MRMKTNFMQKVLAAVLTIAALAAGHISASAASTFSVTSATSGTTTTFTVTRTGDTDAAETVLYRTVSLSAYAGFHFTAKSGSLDFAAGETSKTVNVSESTTNVVAFKHQVGTTRTYRFEVTDWAGVILAYRDRTMTTGNSVSSTAFAVKDMTINSGTITVTDAGYAQAYHSVTVDNYYSAAAPKDYLAAVGAELRMTVTFDAREKDDGYQYIQIYANTTADETHTDFGAGDGEPGNMQYNRYAAGFSIDGNGASTYYSYTFPLTSQGDKCGKVTDAWDHGKANLIQQKFNTDCRATDGRLIIPTDLTSLYVRLNASGNNSDTWYCQNLAAHIQAVETTAPAKYGNGHMHVSGGRHVRGNTFYVALPFSEIVTVTGTPTITTSWGTASYMTGSGTNVLTFRGTIDAAVGTTLAVTALNGTVKDLAGNALTSFQSSYSNDAVEYIPWHGSGTSADPYIISSNADLDQLAARVNSDENFNNTYFLQTADIAYTATKAWDAVLTNENNFTPIGGYGHSFRGTYDGGGHTISGLRISKLEINDDAQSVGLFGFVSGGMVSNVVLRDANIEGDQNIGGIVGYLSGGSVTGCTLYHVRTATARVNQLPATKHIGVVVGYEGGTVTTCHYRDCCLGYHTLIESNLQHINDRKDNVYTLTTGDNTTAAYQSGASVTIDDVTYYAEGCTFTLAYNGTLQSGSVLGGFTATKGGTVSGDANSGYTLTLGAADCTVSVRFASAWEGSGTEGSPYVISTPAQLDLLAKMVNGQGGYGYSDFDGTYFQLGGDITYTHTSDWDDATSTENNYTAIGGWRSGITYNQFKGSFDGHGFTVSGIRIYKNSSGTANGYTGLFGYVGTSGTVKNVTVADARITGQLSVAGIVGLSYGTVTNCTVAADVCVASKNTNSDYHGGIVGKNYGSVSGCTSAVTLTADYAGPDDYGAVVGWNSNNGSITNCLALGTTIPAMADNYGIIVGYNNNGTLTANYYRGCTVGTTANAVGVGAGKSGGAPTDVDGARSVHNLTLPDGVTATGESVTIGTDTYYAAATDVTLSCTGTAPSGYVEPCYYSLDGTNISGSTVTMPASDATVALLWTTDYETGHAGTEADPYIISDYPQLELLASRVNNGYNYSSGKHFKLGADIACFDGENNHAPIGVHVTNKHFFGTFDGDGHTVSGICINSSSNYQGLFGNLSGATVKNVTLAGSTIIGRDEVGGIVGYSFTGTFENCRVLGDVTIGANASGADNHGGIVGRIFGRGTVNGCYSAATVTRDGNSNCTNYGGIVGNTDGTVSNCIAISAWVIGSEESSSGTIVGTNDGTLAHNYYYDCSVKSFANNVGTGSGDVTDNDGAVKTNGIPLLDNYSNDFVLRRYADGQPYDFTLAGRTLYRDGDWNTLCLPFDVALDGSPIEGADVRTLSSTSFDSTTGTLTLTFTDEGAVTTLAAGTPYIIKWNNTEGTENLVSPTFTDVIIPDGYTDTEAINTALTAAAVETTYADFRGTYAPIDFTADDRTKLFLGTANTLYYPQAGAHIGSQRAYFQLNGLTAGDVTNARLFFGDGDETTGVTDPTILPPGGSQPPVWRGASGYTLDGRKLDGKPTKAGLYIHGNKKVVIK